MAGDESLKTFWSGTTSLTGADDFIGRGGAGALSDGKTALACDGYQCFTLRGTTGTKHAASNPHRSFCSAIGRHEGEEGLFLFGGHSEYLGR